MVFVIVNPACGTGINNKRQEFVNEKGETPHLKALPQTCICDKM